LIFLLNHKPRLWPHLFGPFRQMGFFIVLRLRTQRQAQRSICATYTPYINVETRTG